MTSPDYAQIRQELEQMQQALSSRENKKAPALDFGVFILTYFFALVFVATVTLALGFPLQKYTVLYALPPAWLGLAWLRRAPGYALLISALGVAFLAACALLAGQLFDVAWDSNCYHKVDTGMLAYGWNPFKQTLAAFANAGDILPYNSQWLEYQVETQPKASFIIGASFYAFTGNIAYGKVFNLAGMAAAVCILAPMIKDAFRLRSLTAFLAALLACANPITLAQALTYYNDGFMYQMLTVAAVAFAYAAYKPEGRYAGMAKAAAFIAVCLAVNVKTSAALFAAILCLFFYVARVIGIARSEAPAGARRRRQVGLFLYFVALIVTAAGVLGATTYVLNTLRYGNPLYGMLGESSINTLLESLMSPEILRLPLFVQFFASLFSPVTDALFTGISLKIPFTFTNAELTLRTLDANVGGWGLMFSGIFLVSLAVIVRAIWLAVRRRSNAAKLLAVVLLTVFIPVFIIPYLFSARYYLQLFWLPLTALICLFAAPEDGPEPTEAKTNARGRARLLGALLCLLLAFNCATALNYLNMQLQLTADSRETIDAIAARTEDGGEALDVAPMSRGLFYGLLFNLKDEGLENYNFAEYLPQDEIDGTLLYYLTYRLRGGNGADWLAAGFLTSLNRNGYLVVIAKQGALGAPDAGTLALLNALYLEDAGTADHYLAVIDSGAHIRKEESGAAVLGVQVTADALDVKVQSSVTAASIRIGGTEYALGRDGYNIVVYDPVNLALVDSVVIDPAASPSLSR